MADLMLIKLHGIIALVVLIFKILFLNLIKFILRSICNVLLSYYDLSNFYEAHYLFICSFILETILLEQSIAAITKVAVLNSGVQQQK